MHKRILTLIATFLLLSTALSAKFNVDSLLAKTSADLNHAPEIVARAAVKNPKFLVEIVSAAVKAFPDQAVGIIDALLLALPDNFEDIVQAAILAQPKMSVQITEAAVATLPDQAADIIKTAEAAAPADMRNAIGAIVPPVPTASPAGNPPIAPSPFPVQPISPDVVSPSH